MSPASEKLPEPLFSPKRRVRPSRRLVPALSRASVVLLVVAATAAASAISPIGTRRVAREAADKETEALLVAGEREFARVYASERRPADLWRLSHGLLVATDRRLLYVAVPPRTLLRPADDGPPELYVESWPYESAFTLERRGPADEGNRVVVRTPTRSVTLQVDASLNTLADSVRSVAARGRQLAGAEAERLRRSGTPRAQPEQYIRHSVRRGETLTSLAILYRTSVDVLRQLNGLRGDAVQAGQLLRVPEPRANPFPFDTMSDSLADTTAVLTGPERAQK